MQPGWVHAGPDNDFRWITPEPTFDFEALYAQFDTLLMGRRTYEIVRASGEGFRGKEVVVASRSLKAAEHPAVEAKFPLFPLLPHADGSNGSETDPTLVERSS